MGNKEQIINVSKQVSIHLTETEVSLFAEELTDIIEFIEPLNEIDTNEVNEDISVIKKYNAFRKDEVVEYENRELLLKNAPESEEGMYKIPKVMDT
ncbi:MAG: Asp-tRNA(Asn)/Glu-tRNA(Gln) amidotransferase subunit GatC [Clostridia bacterium]|nr:Asp-tRNA(Asn)/Glu-tRNA(Gln) amidotransferase subunit GatC [Clostridia bacterium]